MTQGRRRQLGLDALNLATARDLIDEAVRMLRQVRQAEEPALLLDLARTEVGVLYAEIQDELGEWHPEITRR